MQKPTKGDFLKTATAIGLSAVIAACVSIDENSTDTNPPPENKDNVINTELPHPFTPPFVSIDTVDKGSEKTITPPVIEIE